VDVKTRNIILGSVGGAFSLVVITLLIILHAYPPYVPGLPGYEAPSPNTLRVTQCGTSDWARPLVLYAAAEVIEAGHNVEYVPEAEAAPCASLGIPTPRGWLVFVTDDAAVQAAGPDARAVADPQFAFGSPSRCRIALTGPHPGQYGMEDAPLDAEALVAHELLHCLGADHAVNILGAQANGHVMAAGVGARNDDWRGTGPDEIGVLDRPAMVR